MTAHAPPALAAVHPAPPAAVAAPAASRVPELDAAGLGRDVVDARADAVLEVWAAWCPSCRLLRPKVERLRQQLSGRFAFGRLDADAYPEAVRRLGVRYVPAVVVFADGRPVRRLYGDHPVRELERRIGAARARGG